MNKFEKVSFEQYYQSIAKDRALQPDRDLVRKDYDAIKLPERATKYAAGYDFFAPHEIMLPHGACEIVPTGIRVLLDKDKFLAIYPRSGLGFKYRMQLNNTVGIIDADYANSDNEGHIIVKLYNGSPDKKFLRVETGRAFAQGIIQQYFITTDDAANGVRNGGFGSTDEPA